MAGKVNWYGDRVMLKIKDATDAMVDQAAFLIEGQAKVNITDNQQVDTGFMRGSVYVVTPMRNNYSQAQQSGIYYSKKEKRDVTRQLAPQAPAPAEGAIVAVGARYAVFQELKQTFLFKALETVAMQMQGEIVQAGKAVVND